MKSKAEVYAVLTTEGNLYLPLLYSNFFTIANDWQKKVLSNKDVKIINVLQIKRMKVPQLLQYIRSKLHIDSYLPDNDYAKGLNRSWLANVLNSLIGIEF